MMMVHGTTRSQSGDQTLFCAEVLVDHLRSEDGAVRMRSRETLVKIGKPAVPYVLQLLKDRSEHVRWEACKTLEHIRDPKTARDLAPMLLDEDMDVRWVAANALAELERDALLPLMELIEEEFDSSVLREAAHHVLQTLKEHHLLEPEEEEVLNALKVVELPSKAAFAASRVAGHLRSHPVTHRHHSNIL